MTNASAVETLLFAALEKSNEAERAAFLDSACGGDAELRGRVEKLLKAHADAGDFLQNPAVEQLAVAQESADATLALDPSTDHKRGTVTRTAGEAARDDDNSDLGFLQPSTRPDSLGRLGHYEVLQVLGRGGFGIVFRAFDDILQRVVAVKVMAPQIATLSPARKRFLREARSSAAIRHENVVHIYEVGEQPLPYLVMEFVPGETLQQRLDRCGPLDVSEVLRIGRQVAEGLAAAHACDLIHRDIKPGNILLEGGSHKVKITDFGLARAADDASISQSGVIAGTPMFMAPEQALGHKIDQRADLFSLGSVLYQMASGRPPFRAPSALAVLKRVAEEPPRPIPEIIPETPAWLCGIIAKLHAKVPKDRFQSAREVADLIADCEAKLKAKQDVKNVLPGIARGERRGARGGKKWVAAAAVLLLPLIALAVMEFAGVTHLFRQPVTTGAIDPGDDVLARPAKVWIAGKGAEPNAPADVQRIGPSSPEQLAAARWALEQGSIVTVRKDGKELWVQDGNPYADANFPTQPFTVVGLNISFVNNEKQKPIADADLARFAVLQDLEDLNLALQKITAAGLAHLAPLKELRRLTLGIPAKPADAAVTVRGFTKLEYLYAESAWLQHLAGMPSLRMLDFFRTELGAVEMGHLKQFPNLSCLKISECVPTEKDLFLLKEIKKLHLLMLTDERFGNDVLERLAKELPECEIRKMGAGQHLWWNPGKGKEFYHTAMTWNLRPPFGWVEESWLKEVAALSPEKQAEAVGAKLKEREPAYGHYPEFDGKAKPTIERGVVTGLEVHLTYAMVDLTPVRALTALESLDCSKGDTIRDLSPLKALKLKYLNCAQTRVTDLAPLVGMPLEVLDIRSTPVTDLSPLKKLPLKQIHCDFKPERDTAILRSMKTLESINGKPAAEFWNAVDAAAKDAAAKDPDRRAAEYVLSNGGAVKVNGQDQEIKAAAVLPGEAFRLTGVVLWNADGNQVSVTEAGLAVFKDCKDVTEIKTFRTRLTDAGLANFKNCKNLTSIGMEAPEAVTDDGLAAFKDCKNLKFLRLTGVPLTGAGLVHVKDCKILASVQLYGTQVSDAGLIHLKDSKKLTDVSLLGTQVSDAGLAHLAGLGALTDLDLRATKVTAKGVEDLAKALPKCKLTWDGGAIGPRPCLDDRDCRASRQRTKMDPVRQNLARE